MIFIYGTEKDVNTLPMAGVMGYEKPTDEKKLKIKLLSIANSDKCLGIYLHESFKGQYNLSEKALKKTAYFDTDDTLISFLTHGVFSKEELDEKLKSLEEIVEEVEQMVETPITEEVKPIEQPMVEKEQKVEVVAPKTEPVVEEEKVEEVITPVFVEPIPIPNVATILSDNKEVVDAVDEVEGVQGEEQPTPTEVETPVYEVQDDLIPLVDDAPISNTPVVEETENVVAEQENEEVEDVGFVIPFGSSDVVEDTPTLVYDDNEDTFFVPMDTEEKDRPTNTVSTPDRFKSIMDKLSQKASEIDEAVNSASDTLDAVIDTAIEVGVSQDEDFNLLDGTNYSLDEIETVPHLKTKLLERDRTIKVLNNSIKQLQKDLEDAYILQEDTLTNFTEEYEAQINRMIETINNYKEKEKDYEKYKYAPKLLDVSDYAKKPKLMYDRKLPINEKHRGYKSPMFSISSVPGSHDDMVKRVIDFSKKTKKRLVVVDFTFTQTLLQEFSIRNGHTSVSLSSPDNRNVESYINKLDDFDLVNTAFMHDLVLLEIDWQMVIDSIQKYAKGRPILFLFGSINSFNVISSVAYLKSAIRPYIYTTSSVPNVVNFAGYVKVVDLGDVPLIISNMNTTPLAPLLKDLKQKVKFQPIGFKGNATLEMVVGLKELCI